MEPGSSGSVQPADVLGILGLVGAVLISVELHDGSSFLTYEIESPDPAGRVVQLDLEREVLGQTECIEHEPSQRLHPGFCADLGQRKGKTKPRGTASAKRHGVFVETPQSDVRR